MIRLTILQPVALLGEARPRVLVEPRGVRANSWEDVADLSANAGVTLDGWQETVLRAAMGERTDRTWAAKRVGVSAPRQQGKSQLLVARVLAGALLFGEKKIVVSAHQQATAVEAFTKLMEIIEADGNEWLRKRLDPRFGKGGVYNAFSREAVGFSNGARIQFKARSGAGGKGFSSDCLMLDEAQILGARAWTSINSTMSAMPNPQVWLLGTAPQAEDDSETFESVRAAAISGKSTSATWCEWGADVESPEYAAAKSDLAAKQWSPAVEYLCWTANPAWNARANLEVIQGECETYSPEKFGQDRLGIWPSDSADGSSAITSAQWAATGVEVAPKGRQGFAVAFSLDGSRVSLAGVRVHAGGHHVELIDAMSGPVEAGIGKLADWLAERWRESIGIVISGKAGGPALEQALHDRGVGRRKVRLATTQDYFGACSMTLDAVAESAADPTAESRLTHLASAGQAVLDESVAVCDRKTRGAAGAWGWTSTTRDGDETPVEAFSLAYWLGRTSRKTTSQGRAVFA